MFIYNFLVLLYPELLTDYETFCLGGFSALLAEEVLILWTNGKRMNGVFAFVMSCSNNVDKDSFSPTKY